MKDIFSMRTVRKKMLMLAKLAGVLLIFSYILSTNLPVSKDISFLIWLVSLLLLVLVLDYFFGRFITKPIVKLNVSAKRMAELDFSAPCDIVSADEFGELSKSLNTMAENLQQALSRLEDSLGQRKELADSLSHEMKTPLGVIRAYAEGLQDGPEENDRQKYAQVIIGETERLTSLINTLLDLSALESGAMALTQERFEFIEFVETAAGRLLMDCPDANFQLKYELPDTKAYVNLDKARMEQVIGNLLVNAKKNVIPGGILKLSLTENGEQLRFAVFNQGPQIPKDALPKIWEKFYRGGHSKSGGSGLGLAIVAQVLSMQNIPYEAQNLADGVEFSFSIPIVK
jgi:two-component system sensor histidine kinase VanS